MAELPEPAIMCDCGGNYYTADQLRAAIQAERERCAKLCDELPAKDPSGPWFNHDMSAGAYECAAAIRGQAEGRE